MSIGMTDEHAHLAETVQRWCESEVGRDGRRAGLDSAVEARPDHWRAMVEQGWPVLHIAEDVGGQGFALADLAVVLEETGRACLPGPLLSTALGAAIINRCGTDETRAELLPRIGEGATVAVAFASETVEARVEGQQLILDGRLNSVLDAVDADLMLVPILIAGDQSWIVIDGAGAGPELAGLEVTDPTGIDLTRPLASVVLNGVAVPADRVLTGSPALVTDLAALFLSIEAVGLAAWCVDTAAEYARDRVQFGRPIGQFQGVKHRCADMLASLELIRAGVWDACRGGESDEEHLAITCATALAPDAAVEIAKDCIQVLGGIGFTWEHDAHLYLRRTIATRSLLAVAAVRHAEIVDLARAGVVRTLPAELPPEADAYRADVRAWIESLRTEQAADWNSTIADAGYLVPHWPVPWGRGAGAVEQVVIDQEFSAAAIRRPHLQVAAWALPTLIEHGTPEQQDRWVGPSLRFEIQWCQLFSEPEAGSDLASLRMRAVRDGDGWRLTGQKVWTSMAHTADWGICLARTSPDKPNHEGITCFFIDMASDGIDIRPLREINGDAWFNEVFFDDVWVPDDCVVGAVDDGWRAGRTTLANERVSMGSGASIGAGVASLVELLDADSPPHDIDRVGRLVATDAALSALRTRMSLRALSGADAGPEASVTKLLGVIHDQDVQEAGMVLFGAYAAAMSEPASAWVTSFLWNRCLTIAGGTSEVQRNVIGERLLGLPRDT